MPSLTVYQMPQVVQTTQAGATGVNSATNKIDFCLSKNVTNEIEFLLKDVDRKPSSLANKSIILFVVDAQTQAVKLQKTLQIINAARGHVRLTVNPSDILDWELGYYSFSLVIERADQTQVLVYTDLNRSTHGYFELKAGPLPSPINPVVITDDLFAHATYGVSNQPVSGRKYRVSAGYPGAAQRDNRSGMHTCAIYTSGYTGTFKVQASLDNSVPTGDTEWFDVDGAELVFDNKTGVTSLMFTGSLMWVRLIYVPDLTNTGTVDKVLFKN